MSDENEVPDVKAEVKIIPARRTARYSIPLSASGKGPTLSANVNAKTITFGASADIPKTIEAADRIIALAQAVRAELVAQGIDE